MGAIFKLNRNFSKNANIHVWSSCLYCTLEALQNPGDNNHLYGTFHSRHREWYNYVRKHKFGGCILIHNEQSFIFNDLVCENLLPIKGHKTYLCFTLTVIIKSVQVAFYFFNFSAGSIGRSWIFTIALASIAIWSRACPTTTSAMLICSKCKHWTNVSAFVCTFGYILKISLKLCWTKTFSFPSLKYPIN